MINSSRCDAMWYIFPKKCHNLYKFLLARTLIFSKITAFKVATMSMETFLAVNTFYRDSFYTMVRLYIILL